MTRRIIVQVLVVTVATIILIINDLELCLLVRRGHIPIVNVRHGLVSVQHVRLTVDGQASVVIHAANLGRRIHVGARVRCAVLGWRVMLGENLTTLRFHIHLLFGFRGLLNFSHLTSLFFGRLLFSIFFLQRLQLRQFLLFNSSLAQ